MEGQDMGAIAEAIVAYAQPLLDETDGSTEQLNKAFTISQLCYNLALLPEDSRDGAIGEMRLSLQMTIEDFEDFRRSIVLPMIRRHEEMFPQMHSRGWGDFSPSGPSPRDRPSSAASARPYAGTDRYAPCPCNSGKKYKFCCGSPRR
jgi:hypothetical protein